MIPPSQSQFRGYERFGIESDDYDQCISLTLGAWWESLKSDIPSSFYDVFCLSLDEKTATQSIMKFQANAVLLNEKQMPKLLKYLIGYTHAVFYSVVETYFQEKPYTLIIYGCIACSDILHMKQLIRKDLHSTVIPPGSSEPIVRDFSVWTSLYTDISPDLEISEIEYLCQWRLDMILSNYPKRDAKDYILPKDRLEKWCATEEGRREDNASYHICKMIASSAGQDAFLQKMIQVEKLFMMAKLIRYHPNERDVISLCERNGIDVTRKKLFDAEPFDGSGLLKAFSRNYPNCALPLNVFIVPFEQLDSNRSAIATHQLHRGYACITYMDMILYYFPKRIEIDIRSHAHRFSLVRASKCYAEYSKALKLRDTHLHSDTPGFLAKSYEDSSPFPNGCQLESQVIQPLIAYVTKRASSLSHRNHNQQQQRQNSNDSNSRSPMEDDETSIISSPYLRVNISNFGNTLTLDDGAIASDNDNQSASNGNSASIARLNPYDYQQEYLGEEDKIPREYRDIGPGERDDSGISDYICSIDAQQLLNSLFPPCVSAIIMRSFERHLYHVERNILISFMFSLGIDLVGVGTLWKRICDNFPEKTKSNKYANVEEFLAKGVYGRIVTNLWKSYLKATAQGTQYRVLPGCKSIVNSSVNKDGHHLRSLCPFDEVDIEDIVTTDRTVSCTTQCSRQLCSSYEEIYSHQLKPPIIQSPRGFTVASVRLHQSRPTF